MTFTIRTRGASRPILADFRCPVHGRIEVLADAGADDVPCPAVLTTDEFIGDDPVRIFAGICNKPSPWTPSVIPMRMKRVEATRGNHEKAEHKGWLDTSNLEEGQDFGDWQEDREAVHEELRKELVMEMVKTDR